MMLNLNWLSGARPRMIAVHHYKILDPIKGQWVVPPFKCKAEQISKLKGKIIDGTMNVVARASLDKDGCYDPKTARDKLN